MVSLLHTSRSPTASLSSARFIPDIVYILHPLLPWSAPLPSSLAAHHHHILFHRNSTTQIGPPREELGAEETVIEKIKRRRLTWFGHVERMEGKILPNAALHRHVRGERSRGRPRKRWMDNVREDLEERGIQFIHLFILAISIAPFQVHYYSKAFRTTARILYRSF